MTAPTPERPTTMGEERLAELRKRNRSRGALSIWEIDQLFDEIDRLRAAALRSGRAET